MFEIQKEGRRVRNQLIRECRIKKCSNHAGTNNIRNARVSEKHWMNPKYFSHKSVKPRRVQVGRVARAEHVAKSVHAYHDAWPREIDFS
jgi:hypothetical protein